MKSSADEGSAESSARRVQTLAANTQQSAVAGAARNPGCDHCAFRVINESRDESAKPYQSPNDKRMSGNRPGTLKNGKSRMTAAPADRETTEDAVALCRKRPLPSMLR